MEASMVLIIGSLIMTIVLHVQMIDDVFMIIRIFRLLL